MLLAFYVDLRLHTMPPSKSMAASQIPNLNTLQGPRSLGRGRGRGRGGLPKPESDPTKDKTAKDEIVQQTDQDASVSRLSAVDVGYLNDPFAVHFAEQRMRRFPIINRGIQLVTGCGLEPLTARQVPMFARRQSIFWWMGFWPITLRKRRSRSSR